jgi:hypothetical protein
MTSSWVSRKERLINLVFGNGAVVFFALFAAFSFVCGVLIAWIRWHWHW